MAKRIKVCLVTTTFPRFKEDTVAPFIKGLAEGLSSNGMEVFILTPYDPLFRLDSLKHPFKIIPYRYFLGDWFHTMGYGRDLDDDRNLKLRSYLLAPFFYFFGILSLLSLVKKEKIDVINAHWLVTNGVIGAVVSRFTGVPLVISLPGSDVYLAGKNFFSKILAKLTVGQAKFITANSPQLIEDLKKVIKVKKIKFKIILYGVDPEVFRPKGKSPVLQKSLGLHRDNPLVLGVGRLVAKKGFIFLIGAVGGVLAKTKNDKIRFLIIGDGDQRKILKERIDQLQLRKYFVLPGAISYSQLADYYNLADVFVLPSIRDEKGNLDDQSVVVPEAMSCGKPVITTDFPGYRLLIKNGENGFLSPEKDSNSIARSLIRLLESESLRKRIGFQARKSILEKFTWKLIASEYKQIFQRLLH